jgi:SAM-dependent methyltransferase
MVERTLEWGLFGAGRPVQYTAIDSLPANIAAARGRLQATPAWLDLRLETADVFEYGTRPDAEGGCDLLIAHAFLDLLDIPTALPRLRQLLRPGGIFYFTINFDGATILQPELDPPFDAAIEAAYHRTMDARITDGRPSGDSRTGRHLFGRLPEAGFAIAAAGSSDWVVFPAGGRYPADEAFFLHFIVHTMHGALCRDPQVGGDAFERWIEARHAQIARGELTYIAHQFDFVGRV